MFKKVISCLWAVGLMLLCCNDHVVAQEATSIEQLCRLTAQTPREDSEAEEAALWLSGDFVAPESLYVEISDALKKLRAQYGSQLPIVNEIHFTPYFVDEWIEPVRATASDDPTVDSLTACLRGKIVDKSGHLRIEFDGHFRIDSLASLYAHVGGFRDVAFAGVLFQPTPNVYPWRLADGRLALLFMDTKDIDRRGREFWYFRISRNSIEFVGHCYENDFIERQHWWNEARVAYEKFGGNEDDRGGRLQLN